MVSKITSVSSTFRINNSTTRHGFFFRDLGVPKLALWCVTIKFDYMGHTKETPKNNGVSKNNGTPKWDDLGVPLFLETPYI